MPCFAQLEEKVVLHSLNDLNPLASLQPDPVADGKGTEAPCFTRSGLCSTTGAELPAPGPAGGPGRAERAQHPGTPHAAAGPRSSAEVCSCSWSEEAILLERGPCSCSVLRGVLGRQQPWQEGLVRAGRGGGLGTWLRAENGSCQGSDSPEHGAQRGGAHTGLATSKCAWSAWQDTAAEQVITRQLQDCLLTGGPQTLGTEESRHQEGKSEPVRAGRETRAGKH